MTELIWDGKYDAHGKKQGPVRIALPFQTVETVNESAQDRRRNLELFASGRDTEWRNRLIWGDKKYILPSLLPEFAGKVNLIYIDPPFNTGGDFSFRATIPNAPQLHGADGTSFVKEPSLIEQKAYRDTWGVSPEDRNRGVSQVDRYSKWLYETLTILQELLAEDGTIYIHLDWNVGHYAKVVADEVFSADAFRNEIIWYYTNKLGTGGNTFDKHHDNLYVYVKGDKWTHNPLLRPVKDQKLQPVTKKIEGERIWLRDEEGKRIYEMGRAETKIGDVWEVPYINPVAAERAGYDTQKPEKLLENIITASSRKGELVLDCFVGSGTAAVVAEKLDRRWIACDLSRFAIHTTRKRLLGIPNVKPFVVQNLGKYERQAWQVAEFPANGKNHLEEQREREAAYRKFLLDLYHATSMTGYSWLHGTKSGRMVHVAPVDAPVTQADVKAIAREAWKAIGSTSAGRGKDAPTKAGVDILGWEFALEVNELAKQVAAESRVDVSFKKIPREVLDKKAVEQGDVKFFELGALSVDVKQKGREVALKLSDFVIPTDDIPEEARKAIKHWSQLVDYWAVDWDFKNDTFHNQWQAYRTRKDPKIELETKYEYKEDGKHQVVVKVIDILGNDTTKTLEVVLK
jgi:adenine-specific DNA-methyltransferase